MKILIADDTRVVQMIIKKSIEKCGITDLQIQTASDGLAAYDIVKVWQPDLVITDWHMPIMTGLELLKKIYANGMNHIKVGFITAEPSEKNLEQAKRFGAEFVLNKPCTEEEIIAVIQKVLAKMPAKNDAQSEFFDNSLQSVLSKKFGNLISIQEIDSKPSREFTDTYLITLFGTAHSSAIKAISVIDKRCIYLLGALISDISIAEILDLSTKDGVDSKLAKLAADFLSESGSDIFGSQVRNNKPEILEIKSKGVVSQLPEKVCATIDSGVDRKDFKLTHPDFGDCFMAIVTL